jgi:hypothetical protein
MHLKKQEKKTNLNVIETELKETNFKTKDRQKIFIYPFLLQLKHESVIKIVNQQ